ncbi:MAG: TolC family protein [Bdellovibrionales bacterium]
MKSWILLLGLALATPTVFADRLTMNQYLDQVKSQNPEARAYQNQIEGARLRLAEADASLIPELYASYDLANRKPEQVSNFAPSRTETDNWRAGLRKQFSFGLESNLYFNAQRTALTDAPSFAYKSTDYMESQAVLELRQALWRNGFGDGTRARIEAQGHILERDLLRAKFQLKNILMKAQDAYWSLVSQRQVIRLQEENVARSAQLRDLMRKKQRQRLVDDVDAIQAQASHESRELELETSRNEHDTLARQLNVLRGRQDDQVEELESFLSKEFTQAATKLPDVTREDFEAVLQEAEAADAGARASRSDIQPKLDLVASAASNGIDGQTSRSFAETQETRHPSWAVGVQFSVALDFSRIHQIRQGHAANRRAARDLAENAKFSLNAAYDDLVKKYHEAQRRFTRTVNLEETQTDLVKRERHRLLNGRTTTFQAITFEQNLATSQIQRIKAQLALIQLHNILKTFEVSP